MTETQTTRQQNKAARDAARAERNAQEKADKALMLEALRAVLQDPEATAEQRLFAVTVLDAMQHYHLVPCGAEYPAGPDNDKITADFARQLETANKTT